MISKIDVNTHTLCVFMYYLAAVGYALWLCSSIFSDDLFYFRPRRRSYMLQAYKHC